MKHLYLLLLTIFINNPTITMDSDDDTEYGDVVCADDTWEQQSVHSSSSKLSYDSQLEAQRLEQKAQDLQELHSALQEQICEYKNVMNYVQTHKEEHPQLSVYIIDQLESLTTLITDAERKTYLEIHNILNYNLWQKTEELINLHDENKWIFIWFDQEQAKKTSIDFTTSKRSHVSFVQKKRDLVKKN